MWAVRIEKALRREIFTAKRVEMDPIEKALTVGLITVRKIDMAHTEKALTRNMLIGVKIQMWRIGDVTPCEVGYFTAWIGDAREGEAPHVGDMAFRASRFLSRKRRSSPSVWARRRIGWRAYPPYSFLRMCSYVSQIIIHLVCFFNILAYPRAQYILPSGETNGSAYVYSRLDV